MHLKFRFTQYFTPTVQRFSVSPASPVHFTCTRTSHSSDCSWITVQLLCRWFDRLFVDLSLSLSLFHSLGLSTVNACAFSFEKWFVADSSTLLTVFGIFHHSPWYTIHFASFDLLFSLSLPLSLSRGESTSTLGTTVELVHVFTQQFIDWACGWRGQSNCTCDSLVSSLSLDCLVQERESLTADDLHVLSRRREKHLHLSSIHLNLVSIVIVFNSNLRGSAMQQDEMQLHQQEEATFACECCMRVMCD